jgi:murein DD-endopeptidase MepM/ murein hydrolase activator NlpD
MTLRDGFPKARLTTSHVLITIARGERERTIGMSPIVFWLALGVGPLLFLLCVSATLYVIFHDDMVAALMRRQGEMQFAYEDQLASMRGEVDRVVSRQLLDQDSLEGQVHRLVSHQAQLENRAAVIAQMADTGNAPIASKFVSALAKTKSTAVAEKPKSAKPLLAEVPEETAPDNPAAYAPILRHELHLPTAAEKPHPETLEGGFELPIGPASPRAALDAGEDPMNKAGSTWTIADQLKRVDASLEHIEGAEMQTLAALNAGAQRSAAKLENVFAVIGLPSNVQAAKSKGAAFPATGGPFVPLTIDAGSPFEQALLHLQTALNHVAQLTRLVAATPLQHPLAAGAEMTSGFGGRVDPFNGRTAIHTGVDFRGEYGTPVHVTAAGRVSIAALTGGYGKMVEVDHGNGVSTRYAHLSEINVQEGQTIVSGAVVGALGSTGRSTGPHLHYETRIDGEPVDPLRFLRAASKLAADE